MSGCPEQRRQNGKKRFHGCAQANASFGVSVSVGVCDRGHARRAAPPARLARRSLVELAPDRDDRRLRRVQLTETGRRVLEAAPLAGPVRLRVVPTDARRAAALADALEDAVELFGLTPWEVAAARADHRAQPRTSAAPRPGPGRGPRPGDAGCSRSRIRLGAAAGGGTVRLRTQPVGAQGAIRGVRWAELDVDVRAALRAHAEGASR